MQELVRNMTQSGIDANDTVIREELTRAEIPIVVKSASSREPVSCSLRGELGGFLFTRESTYWMVKGQFPFNKAKELNAGMKIVWSVPSDGSSPVSEFAVMDEEGLTLLVRAIRSLAPV